MTIKLNRILTWSLSLLALIFLVACGATDDPRAADNTIVPENTPQRAPSESAATATPLPPTSSPPATASSLPAHTQEPTMTLAPSLTPSPPATATESLPTNTPPPTLPSTSTPLPPTSTPLPPTSTPPPPTSTPLPPTSTPPSTLPPSPPPPASEERYTVVDVATNDQLNVRANPGIEHDIIGTLTPANMDIYLTGAEQEVGNSRWVEIHAQGLTGWVNSYYLAQQKGQMELVIAKRANEVVLALRARDMSRLSTFVHPEKGLRFSPYSYIRLEEDEWGKPDLVFSAEHISTFFDDPTIYHWGTFDGTGEAIDYTFERYFTAFVYDADFANPQTVGYNKIIGRGNTINNIADVYPNASFVEYHFDGFEPQFEGLDWRSLRLVFEKSGDTWYLVGIVHDQWTI